MNRTNPRLVKNNSLFLRGPAIALAIAIVLLAWEVLVAILGKGAATLPWARSLVGVAPAASFVGVIVLLIFTRRQYVLTTTPYLAGHSDGWNGQHSRAEWSLVLFNPGGALLKIDRVVFDLRLLNEAETSGLTALEVRERLVSHALPLSSFDIHDLSPGFPLSAGMKVSDGLLLVRFDRRAAVQISHLKITVHHSDLLRNTYEFPVEPAEVALFRTNEPRADAQRPKAVSDQTDVAGGADMGDAVDPLPPTRAEVRQQPLPAPPKTASASSSPSVP